LALVAKAAKRSNYMRHDQSNLHDKMNHFGSYLHFVAEAADQLSGFSANPNVPFLAAENLH